MGYKILTKSLDPITRWEAKWEDYYFQNENFEQLFNFIWNKHRTAKLASFLWQIAHRGLPTASFFLAFRDASCKWSQQPLELIEHCLRDCPRAVWIWNLALRFYLPWQRWNPPMISIHLNYDPNRKAKQSQIAGNLTVERSSNEPRKMWISPCPFLGVELVLLSCFSLSLLCRCHLWVFSVSFACLSLSLSPLRSLGVLLFPFALNCPFRVLMWKFLENKKIDQGL